MGRRTVTRKLLVAVVDWIEARLKRSTTLLGLNRCRLTELGDTGLDELSMEFGPSCSSLVLN